MDFRRARANLSLKRRWSELATSGSWCSSEFSNSLQEFLIVSHDPAHRVGRVDDMVAPRPPPVQRKAVRAAVADKHGHLRMPCRSGGSSRRKTMRSEERRVGKECSNGG